MTVGVVPTPVPWVRISQFALSAALLALLWKVADGPESARIVSAANPAWLLAGLLALTLQTVLSAIRWRLTARQLGVNLPAMHALQEYYLAQMVNQAAPGGVVGDAARAVRSRHQAGLLAAGQAVIFERLAGQIAMFLTMALAFVITYSLPGGFDWPHWLVPPVVIILAIGAVLPVSFLALTGLPGRIGRLSKSLGRSMAAALAAPNVLPWQVVLSFGTTLVNLAAFAFCARAVGVILPPAILVALVPLILFTMLIPFTISGWGVREGAAAAVLPLAGATTAEGLAASVAFGLVLLVAVLPGFVPLWLRSR